MPLCVCVCILSLLTFLNHLVLDVYSLELDWALLSILKTILKIDELNPFIFIEMTEIFGLHYVILFHVIFSLCTFYLPIFLM